MFLYERFNIVLYTVELLNLKLRGQVTVWDNVIDRGGFEPTRTHQFLVHLVQVQKLDSVSNDLDPLVCHTSATS